MGLAMIRTMLESNLKSARDQHANAIYWINANSQGVAPNAHAVAGSATDLARNQARIEVYEEVLALLDTLEDETPGGESS